MRPSEELIKPDPIDSDREQNLRIYWSLCNRLYELLLPLASENFESAMLQETDAERKQHAKMKQNVLEWSKEFSTDHDPQEALGPELGSELAEFLGQMSGDGQGEFSEDSFDDGFADYEAQSTSISFLSFWISSIRSRLKNQESVEVELDALHCLMPPEESEDESYGSQLQQYSLSEQQLTEAMNKLALSLTSEGESFELPGRVHLFQKAGGLFVCARLSP